MNLRWLWFDHIPPELNVPKEGRWLVTAVAKQWRRTKPELLRGDRWTRFVFAIACLGILVALSIALFLAFPNMRNVRIVSGGVLGAAAWVVATREVAYWNRPYVRRALCCLGYLCCVKCGYPHIGLSKDVKECPECGTAREFGKCIHCNSPQDWPMEADDRCTQCGAMRLS